MLADEPNAPLPAVLVPSTPVDDRRRRQLERRLAPTARSSQGLFPVVQPAVNPGHLRYPNLVTGSARRKRAALFLTAVVLSSCRAGHPHPAAPELPAAAEPAVAPVPVTPPAGRVVALPGGAAEGVAVDPVTHLVVVALRRPDRLAFVDARTLLVVRVEPAPGRARHLELAAPGGPVLLPGEDTDVLVEVGLPSGAAVRRVAVGRQPHDASVVDGRVWVADEFASSVSVVAGDRVVAVLRGPVQPGGVAVDGGVVGVVDVRGGRLYLYDATTFAARGSVAVGAGPSHVVPVGGGRVVVADTRGSAVLLVDLGRRRVVARLPIPGSDYGLASDAATGDVWVTLTGRNLLVHVTTRGDVLRAVGTVATVQQPNTVAVDPSTSCLYVAGAAASQLQQVCPPRG